jgi:hypothetical protein
MMEGRLESALTGIKFLKRKTSVAALGVPTGICRKLMPIKAVMSR